MTITKWLGRGAVAVAFAASVGFGAAPATTNGTQVTAASNGEIIIGSTATNGQIHIGGAISDPDSGGQVPAVLDQNAPPTIRD